MQEVLEKSQKPGGILRGLLKESQFQDDFFEESIDKIAGGIDEGSFQEIPGEITREIPGRIHTCILGGIHEGVSGESLGKTLEEYPKEYE